MPPQNEGFEKLSMKDTFNIFSFVCNGLGACVVVFLRTGFGKEYPGVHGLAGLIFMVLYAGFAHVPQMFSFIGVWLIVVALQRIKTFQLARQGVVVHSRFWGNSWLARLLPRAKQRAIISCVEPMLCALVGLALMGWSRGVGQFVIVAGCANAMSAFIVVEVNRKKLQAMRDAEIEQRHLAGQYRGDIEEM